MQQTIIKGIQDYGWLGEKLYPLGIVQEIKNLPCLRTLYAQIRIWCDKNATRIILNYNPKSLKIELKILKRLKFYLKN